ncbi:MAG: hypothetical protein KC613_06680 [Myxococcales bacterium]|nr:hypothetical protein [Myxococcales bacterium]MCB9525093.1 hypothetical protein [Myxococcales bacterium]
MGGLRWLAAFAVTQAVEAPIYAQALTHRRRRWAWALALSAVTHPVVFFVFPRFWPGGWLHRTVAAEAFAVAMEAVGLTLLGVPRSLVWALLANGASVAVGLTARHLWGWP